MYLISFANILGNVVDIVLAFVVLMIMIVIHEFGHYVAGKILKFQINEFSIGFGPKIVSKTKKNGEQFSLRLLPLGGYCAFEGEDEENDEQNPKAFNSQKPWKRLIVLFAGVFFNFVSAIIIASITFASFGFTVTKVNTVYDYAPVQNQQLVEGDKIVSINGKFPYISGDISYYVDDPDNISMVVDRNGTQVEINGLKYHTFTLANVKSVDGAFLNDENMRLVAGDVVYKINDVFVVEQGQFQSLLDSLSGQTVVLTVQKADVGYVDFQLEADVALQKVIIEESAYTGIGMSISYAKMNYGFFKSLAMSFPYCFEVAKMILQTLGGLITGSVGIEAVGGPISTIGVVSQVIATSFESVLLLFVMISVNLAVFNILPIPALDGFQILFTLFEMIFRKPVNRKVQGIINTVGLIVLLVLVFLIDFLKL